MKKETDKEQSQRFIEKAKELNIDESVESFEEIVKKIIPAKLVKKKKKSPKDFESKSEQLQ